MSESRGKREFLIQPTYFLEIPDSDIEENCIYIFKGWTDGYSEGSPLVILGNGSFRKRLFYTTITRKLCIFSHQLTKELIDSLGECNSEEISSLLSQIKIGS